MRPMLQVGLASRRLVRPLLQVGLASRRLVAAHVTSQTSIQETGAAHVTSQTSIRETGAAHVTSRTGIPWTGADTLSVFSQPSVLVHTKNHSYDRKEWKVIPANSSDGGALPTAVSKMVTRMVRHYDQDERQSDAALHWDTIRPLLLKAFAKHGARDFSEKNIGFDLFVKEAARRGSSTVRIPKIPWLTYEQLIQGHSRGLTIDPELMEHIPIPYNWKEFIFHWGCSFSIQSVLENGLIPGGKGKQGRTTDHLLPHHSIRSRKIPAQKNPRNDNTIPQKVHYHSYWKRDQDAVHWIKLSRAQDQGLRFWQTKSHAIIVHNPVPADCIYKVISQKGFERLSTPRPAPKLTLKSNSHSQQQQQQQSFSDDVYWCKESCTGQIGERDVRGNTTDDQTSTRKPCVGFWVSC